MNLLFFLCSCLVGIIDAEKTNNSLSLSNQDITAEYINLLINNSDTFDIETVVPVEWLHIQKVLSVNFVIILNMIA